MTTFSTKNKSGLKNLLIMALVLGLVIAATAIVSCKDEEEDPCCTASTWESLYNTYDGTDDEILAAYDKLPACCKNALDKIAELDSDASSAELKAAAGCCYDAMNKYFNGNLRKLSLIKAVLP